MIQPGTLCYLVRTTPTYLGRVVEVITVERQALDGTGLWHVVDASWLREMFGDRECQAQPCNLRPIADGDPRGGVKNSRSARFPTPSAALFST